MGLASDASGTPTPSQLVAKSSTLAAVYSVIDAIASGTSLASFTFPFLDVTFLGLGG